MILKNIGHWSKDKKLSEKIRKKISSSIKGKKFPKELYPNYGMRNKKHTEKWKKKMSLFYKGKTFEERLGKEKAKKAKEKLRLARLGEKNPFYGKKHTKEALKKISIASKNREFFDSFKIKMSLLRKEQWKNDKEYAKKMYLLGKERWKNEKFAKKMFKKFAIRPNKPEKLMIELIKENNLPFNYVGDGQIWFDGFNPDFLSKNPKHIIEVFGDYWHNLENKKLLDKERLKTYAKYGYKTLIIWEHELKNPNQVVNKIKGFIVNET